MKSSISLNSKNLNSQHQEAEKNTPNSGVYLGNTPIHRPTPNGGASSVPEKIIEIDSDGVALVAPDALENRIIRYQRQSSSRRLLPKKRVAKCLRARIAKNVLVLKSKEHNKCHYGDLMICGSVWDCPVCAGKISERRRPELVKAVKQFEEAGGSVYLVTFTYAHREEDDLKELLIKQSKAMVWFYSHKTYKELKKRYMKQGRVRALEVNHGDLNGWHPHIHELWFLDLHLHDFDTLKREIFTLWVKACAKYGLGEPSWKHGVDVRGGGDAASYVAKFGLEEKKPGVKAWGIEDELARASSKKGRNGSRSAFQLLDDYIEGDKQSGALFAEYSKAFHLKRQLVWSRGFKARFDLDEKTDDDLAHEQDDIAVVLAEIEPEEWTAIVRTSTPKHDNRVIVLTLAEKGGADVMHQFITDLVTRYKLSH